MAKISRSEAREKRHRRVRKHISGTPQRPRLCVFRSLAEIYAQVIDDERGHTLAADYQRLRQRAAVEQRLAAYADLTDITAGLWNGLKTRATEVDQALKFQVNVYLLVNAWIFLRR